MATYKIEWENELKADSPLQAAQEAFDDIKSGNALAFTVTELKTGKRFSVDLNEEEGDEVSELED